jgi:4'-phosphopantetheinyl transferase
MLHPLSETEVHLWYMFVSAGCEPRLMKRLLPVLSPEERVACGKFVFEKDRLQYLLAHSLLRQTLSQYAPVRATDWRFIAEDYGKPQIALPLDEPLYFNLSHTEGLVACVVARQPLVGVDAEHLGRSGSLPEIARHFFAPAEVAYMEQHSPSEQHEIFFNIWTLKEAYIKARGLGLSLPLQEFAFELKPGQPPEITFSAAMNDSPERWQFETLRLGPQHIIAIAARRQAESAWRLLASQVTIEELLSSSCNSSLE